MLDKIKTFVYTYKVQILALVAFLATFTHFTETKLDDEAVAKLPALIEMLAPENAEVVAE